MKIDPSLISEDAAYLWQAATIAPRPIAWISTLNEDGSSNLAPFSFFTGACSDPPMCIVSISKREVPGEPQPVRKDTWRNIERTGEYVVHAVPAALVEKMNQTSVSHPYGFDELHAYGLHPAPSVKVAPPRVAEAPIAMECRLDRIVEIGRGGTGLILGEILLWHVADEVLVDGRIDPAKLDLVGRLGGAEYTRTRDRFVLPRPKL